MSTSDDYRDGMTKAGMTAEYVDELIRGEHPDDELHEFVQDLRLYGNAAETPPMAALLAEVARGSRAEEPPRTSVRRIAVALAASLTLLLLTGVALAADDASPGDALYPVDLIIEDLGLDPGGVDERIEEFDSMVAAGQDEDALQFLAEYIDTADIAEVDKAQHHLELAATKSNPEAADAQEKVAALKAFIELNKGKGVGLDGADFGKAVSEIARSKVGADESSSTGRSEEPGPPDQVGPDGDKEPGPPDNAGPKKDKEPGPPDNAGPKKDKEPGPPDNAGPKKDK